MTLEMSLFVVALVAAAVSAFGIFDAVATMRALMDSKRSWDINARVLARAGIRSAFLRALQMFGLLHVAHIAITKAPLVGAPLRAACWALVGVCCLSATTEILAIWDRRHIVDTVTPPEGWAE